VRRNEQVVVFPLQIADGHVLKELRRVLPDLLAGGDIGKIGILLGGLFVVVAGADLRDVLHAGAVLAGDQADLGMHLVGIEAVEDVAAGLLQTLRPIDVVLLVKAGAQLDQGGDVLAVFGGSTEIFDQLGAAGHAVDRDFDGLYRRVEGRFADHLQKRLHGFKGIRQQNVPLENLIDDAFAGDQHGGGLRRKGLIEQRRAAALGELVGKREGVAHFDGRRSDVALFFLNMQLLAEILAEFAADFVAQFQSYRGQAAALFEQLAHGLAEILVHLKGFVVGGDVGVARDAERCFFQHLIGRKELFGLRQHDLGYAHIPRALTRQQQDVRQRSGQRNHAENGAVFVLKRRADVHHLVGQMREGMMPVHDLGRENRLDFRLEILLDELCILFAQLFDGQIADAFFTQQAFEL